MSELIYPWNQSPLNEWTIVGMNHYFNGKDRSSNGKALYVAMRKGDLCISAEGRDDEGVWKDLRIKTILVQFPKTFMLDFDPKKSTDPHIKTIFEDRYGGLVWCALRHARLTDQYFNEKIAKCLTSLRARPNWTRDGYWIDRELPRSIFGNSESVPEWGEALSRMTNGMQGVWDFKVRERVK